MILVLDQHSRQFVVHYRSRRPHAAVADDARIRGRWHGCRQTLDKTKLPYEIKKAQPRYEGGGGLLPARSDLSCKKSHLAD